MPAGGIRSAHRIQHRSVVVLNVDAEASRVTRAGGARLVDIVDKRGDQHDVIVSHDVGMSGWASPQLAKPAHRVCEVVWAIDTYGPLKILPQLLVSGRKPWQDFFQKMARPPFIM